MPSDKFKLGELTQAVKDVDKRLGGIENFIQDHDKRIDSLENWRWYMVGIMAVIVFIVSVFAREIYAVIK